MLLPNEPALDDMPSEQTPSSQIPTTASPTNLQPTTPAHLPPASPSPDLDQLLLATLADHQVTCALCKLHITTSEGVSVNNKCYHPACFSCTTCKKQCSPSDQIFMASDDRIVCSDCKIGEPALTLTVETCRFCKKPIEGEVVVALGGKWHADCFTCAGCGVVLVGPFRESGGLPYCEPCWLTSHARLCAACEKPISEQVMGIEGRDYHVECVKCQVCGKEFDNVLDILKIEQNFWHVDCFKESDSDSQSICSATSALVGVYNKSLGLSGSTTSVLNHKNGRRVSNVSFTSNHRQSLAGSAGAQGREKSTPNCQERTSVSGSDLPAAEADILRSTDDTPEIDFEKCQNKNSSCCAII